MGGSNKAHDQKAPAHVTNVEVVIEDVATPLGRVPLFKNDFE